MRSSDTCSQVAVTLSTDTTTQNLPPPGDVSPESVRGVPPELKKNEMRFRPPQLSDEEER